MRRASWLRNTRGQHPGASGQTDSTQASLLCCLTSQNEELNTPDTDHYPYWSGISQPL